MNFQDEDYRRLYIRRTVTNRRLGWEGRAVMHELLYEFDRSGVFEFGDDAALDISDLVDLPLDVVQRGLTRLLATRTWVMTPGRIVWSNFVEAQNCPRSDRLRQQELRERRRDESLRGAPIAKTAELTSGVTLREPVSRESQTVTPNRADPNLAEQQQSARDADAADSDFEDLPATAREPRNQPAILQPPEPAQGRRTVFFDLDGWECPPELVTEAEFAGLPRAVFDKRLAKLREGPIAGKRGTFDRTKFVRMLIPDWRNQHESDQARERSAQSSPRASPFAGNDLDTTGAATAFRASEDDRKYAQKHALDLDRAVRDYRASPKARALDTPTQARDFTNRLKCWAATGQWIVDGPLPQRRKGGREAA